MGRNLPHQVGRTADRIRKRLGLGGRRHHKEGDASMAEDRMTSTFGSNWMCAAVLSVLLACAPWLAHAQTRFELRPLETITLSTQQLLLGEKNGTPVMLAEEIRTPKPGTDRLPAVILMHSAGAINPATDQ